MILNLLLLDKKLIETFEYEVNLELIIVNIEYFLNIVKLNRRIFPPIENC